MSRGTVLLFILAIMAFTGPLSGQANATQGVITGTVTYRQRVSLPLDAAIAVRLLDASLPEANAKVLSESIISAAGHEVPIPFELTYDPAEINPSHTYQVRATITANGTLLFTSTTVYRVLTHGAPSRVAIMLQEAGAAAAASPHLGTVVAARPAITLQETTWKLITLGGQPILAEAGETEPQIVLHKNQNTLSGSGGCKEILGTYILAQNALQFTLTDTLVMACPPEVTRQEQLFFKTMKATREYRIVGDTLELLLGNEVLATLRAEKKK